MENDKKILKYTDLKLRYNNVGEWKPLVFNGDINALGKEVDTLSKGEYDKRVYGALYYIKATTCNVIEFIVKTHFEIPSDFQQIGSQYGKIQLHKIAFTEDYFNVANIQVYDGTLELVGKEIDDIKNGLSFIDVTLHRLAFRIDTKLEWFLKYPHHDSNPNGVLSLSDDDMDLLKEYLVDNLKGEDSIIFDVAISWYINGNNSNNVFVKFLSYCIAMESLVDSFLSGKMEASSKFGIGTSEKIEEELVLLIKSKHNELYDKNPEQFIRETYSELFGIQKKFRKAMEIVFGMDHKYLSLFFDKKDKYKIYDLRSELAHGSFNVLNSEHKEIIEKRLPDLKHVAHDFITRMSTGTLKDESPKKIRSQHGISIVFNNPRGIGVASSLDSFSNKDWRIKPDWLF